MAAPVDLELKKAFTELQAKVIDTQQKVKLADIQIEQLNRTKKHAHLTDTEIMTLVDETNMYEGVGRMFILQSKEAIHNQLLEKQKIAEEKIKELEQLAFFIPYEAQTLPLVGLVGGLTVECQQEISEFVITTRAHKNVAAPRALWFDATRDFTGESILREVARQDRRMLQ
ncbi:PREDICTED: prefoldin subunit 1 isoform X1 [Cercocebus atys]|uniref:prefoldin subunit 1 isoform X1 n=1 Tax=Cercocebus atys TaxID=9531 RepID=UPI0005F37C7E|nr:PREDICTED: prefoldin subunit 1 isoform X1 [Cercocebus atys]